MHMMPPHALSAESRQQCRVYVHHAVVISLRNFPQAKPPALDDKINFCGDKLLLDMFAEAVYVGVVLFANVFYIQPCVFGSFNTGCG